MGKYFYKNGKNRSRIRGRNLMTEKTQKQLKSFEKLMDRLDKAKIATKNARIKESELLIMVQKRAKFLNIKSN